MGEKISEYVYTWHPKFYKNEIVEVDETYEKWTLDPVRDKYSNDILGKEGNWVMGMVSRSTNTIWLQPVTDRSSVALLTPMLRRIERGTIIISDALNAYKELSLHGYDYKCINKQKDGFARREGTRTEEEKNEGRDSRFNVHVNSIEGTWRQLREYLHRHHMEHGKHIFYCCNYYIFDRMYGCYFKAIQAK